MKQKIRKKGNWNKQNIRISGKSEKVENQKKKKRNWKKQAIRKNRILEKVGNQKSRKSKKEINWKKQDIGKRRELEKIQVIGKNWKSEKKVGNRKKYETGKK